jgi:hypothetical protein
MDRDSPATDVVPLAPALGGGVDLVEIENAVRAWVTHPAFRGLVAGFTGRTSDGISKSISTHWRSSRSPGTSGAAERATSPVQGKPSSPTRLLWAIETIRDWQTKESMENDGATYPIETLRHAVRLVNDH